MESLLLRTLVALGLVLAGIAGYRFVVRGQLRRAGRSVRGLEGLRPGVPAILYFTTTACQPCQTVQRPALRQLEGMMGERLQVIQVNATEQPGLADYWGVLSVPTTFLIDSSGRPRQVNHGVARANHLLQQLEAIEAGARLAPGTGKANPQDDYPTVS